MKNGMHRVYLRASDGDFVIVFVPLNDEGRVDKGASEPWLVKAAWDGDLYYGEFEIGEGRLNRFAWLGSDGEADSVTDFGTVPVKQGSVVRIHKDDESSDRYVFTVIDVRRV